MVVAALRAARLLLVVHAVTCLAPPSPSLWSEAQIADGSRAWIAMIQARTICPLARPTETKIATSKLLAPRCSGHPRGGPRGSAPPPAGFEMLDAYLIQKEAALLLSSAPLSSTMVVHPHATLDGLTAAYTGAEVAAAEGFADAGSGGSASATVSTHDEEEEAANRELGVAAESVYSLNRWLAALMPSDEVCPRTRLHVLDCFDYLSTSYCTTYYILCYVLLYG